jgi:hypothetical protein
MDNLEVDFVKQEVYKSASLYDLILLTVGTKKEPEV